MSTKPTIANVRWADVGGANLVVPTSGERDGGFQSGTPASAGRVNSLFHENFLWAQYLNDGALSGNHSIAGTLEVANTLTCDAAAVVAGAITIGGQLLAFTDFTFTADSTTDQLTKTAHGLETGDGPVRTSNSGGALPGGLTAGTDYWVIKVDANNLKLAISSDSNAFAGIAIDITSNGTGTQTLNHQATTKRSSDATVTRNLTVGGNEIVSGTLAVSGRATFSGGVGGALSYTSISPAALSTGNNNNYNPTGLSTSVIIRFTNASGGAPVVTGIAAPSAPSDGRILIIYNETGDTVTFTHNDSNSLAANRLFNPSLASLTMITHVAFTFLYDGTSSLWRLIAKNN